MSSTYVSVEFRDIGDQDTMIDQVKSALLEMYQVDGEEYLKRPWNDPQPETWQEAFVRYEDIDTLSWEDYVNGDDKKAPDWDYILGEYAAEKAEDKLYDAFHHLEVEVEL